MISKQLTIIRKQHNLTMKEVSEAIGVSLSAYQKYENGTRDVSTEILSRFADLFNVTTDYLLGREINETTQTVDELACEFNMTALEKKILDNYLSLPQNMRTDLMEFLHKSVQEVMEESN